MVDCCHYVVLYCTIVVSFLRYLMFLCFAKRRRLQEQTELTVRVEKMKLSPVTCSDVHSDVDFTASDVCLAGEFLMED